MVTVIVSILIVSPKDLQHVWCVSGLLWCTGANKATKAIEKEAAAFLLPAAIKYLQQLSKPAAHAARAQHSTAESASMTAVVSAAEQASVSSDNSQAEGGPPDAVRAFFAAQVRQFMTAKLKAPQGKDLGAMLCMSSLTPCDRFLCWSCFSQEGLLVQVFLTIV